MPERTRMTHNKISRRHLFGLGGAAVVAVTGLTVANWRDLRYLMTTSGGPYLNPDWDEHTRGTDTDTKWASFESDPDAGPHPQDWHTVGIARATVADMEKLQAEHPGWLQAIAFTDPGGHQQAGYNYEGHTIFDRDPTNPDNLMLGLRIGGAAVKAALCIYDPGSHLIIPAQTQAVGEWTSTDTMSQDFPGVHYA
jgi:hypothetical protein